MASVTICATPELTPEDLAAIRALLDDVFAGEFSDHDWDHALGGVHVLLHEGPLLIGHGSVVERQLHYGDRPMRVGYVEAMGVHRDHQRRGHGGTIMAALEHQIHARYELGALSATDEGAGLYRARGWVQWTGPTVPDAHRGVYVLPLALPVDPQGTLRADHRDGDVW